MKIALQGSAHSAIQRFSGSIFTLDKVLSYFTISAGLPGLPGLGSARAYPINPDNPVNSYINRTAEPLNH
jgi:hypothetical protein